ncbi:hypothetical protein [Corynebacterium sp. HMSC070H05]|nr:hypothetical protein [Corynebacterium sp. HMSC070H05]
MSPHHLHGSRIGTGATNVGLPRTRGDEPRVMALVELGYVSAPHSRG